MNRTYGVVHIVLVASSRPPVDRAQHSMFGNSLECFEQAQSFKHAATNGDVVECDLNMVSIREVLPMVITITINETVSD